jgi:hypothetical protein
MNDEDSTAPPRDGTVPPGDDTVPPRGWEIPREQQAAPGGPDPDPLTQVIEQLLTLVPAELRARLTEAVRQLLEALRELIDWCVSKLERRTNGEVEVRDIPIL